MLLAPSAMVEKNSLASDFITRAMVGSSVERSAFSTLGDGRDAQPAHMSTANIHNAKAGLDRKGKG